MIVSDARPDPRDPRGATVVLPTRRTQPFVIGFLRTDLCRPLNSVRWGGPEGVEEQSIRALVDRHRWQLLYMLRVQPQPDVIAEPIEHLLTFAHMIAPDAIVVPKRLHLRDARGYDCLEAVSRVCAVVTATPEKLWPCTGDDPAFDDDVATRPTATSW
ncbi:hypothetical protein [Nocardia blacklockiae]|uniref:hypothetical protein n=1 Tax=Nocardia blacklockiae TaxID=480036 RepID=UPI001892E873|nr:hypothetical protein [Nocardia blacklockiae]MBF6171750.1 hypothetical protein [Nocardia blacklockiae]